LLNGVVELVRSLGGYAKKTVKLSPKYTYLEEIKTGRPSYSAVIIIDNLQEFIRSPRILSKYTKRKKSLLPSIASVDCVREDFAQCIAVSHPSKLYITDGYTVTHNTALAMNIAENVIMRGDSVLVFSAEMSREELMERMISSSSGILADRIRRGTLEENDWSRLSAGVSKIKDKPLFIDDRGGLSINKIISGARRMHKKHNIKLIIIDYLQLLSAKASSREQEISAISRGLKGLAKELDVPIIALSQLNRKCEERTNKRPNLSDLRDSGAIEQDADMVAFIYRDEFYNENSDFKGTAEIIFAKGRGFPTGTVYLASKLHINKFDDLEHQPKAQSGKGSTGGFDYE
jgi:replicative DNA helicase